MTPTEVAVAISGGAVFLSLLGTAVGVGVAYATLKAEVRSLKERGQDYATKADIRSMELDLREIKGMFRLTPVDPPGGARAPVD